MNTVTQQIIQLIRLALFHDYAFSLHDELNVIVGL
jgi:hypothetical protein